MNTDRVTTTLEADMAAAGPTLRRRLLGLELRRLREGKGLTREQVAERLGFSLSLLSRIEGGKVGVRVLYLRGLLDLYEVSDPATREDLEGHAKAGTQRGWWSGYAAGIRSGYSTYVGFEEEAASLQAYEALVVPGLLQTEDYARATLQPVGLETLAPEVIEKRVELRMERQRRLTGENRIDLWVIIDEAVIRRIIGSRQVMAEQLARLARAASEPNIRLQVVPFAGSGEWPGLIGSFVILRFPDPTEPIVYVEGLTADTFVEGPEVDSYNLLFDGLQVLGAPYADSIAMIERAAQALATQSREGK